MIATRLHVKRHSTSSLHRPRISSIRHDSHLHPIANIDDEIDNEVDETTQVQLTFFLSPIFFVCVC